MARPPIIAPPLSPAMAAAGWRVVGLFGLDPAEARRCPGSGQLAALLDRDAFVICPACGRRVAAIIPGELADRLPARLVAHDLPDTPADDRPPADDLPTLGL